jgi:alanyl-tRNA synthetase
LFVEERRKLEKELADAKRKLAMGGGASGGGDAPKQVNGISFIGRTLTGIDAKDLKGMADEAKAGLATAVVLLIAVAEDGKASAVVSVTPDLTDRLSAVDLVRVASVALGGKGGGGRPDMAQAGGPDGGQAEAAIAAVEAALG